MPSGAEKELLEMAHAFPTFDFQLSPLNAFGLRAFGFCRSRFTLFVYTAHEAVDAKDSTAPPHTTTGCTKPRQQLIRSERNGLPDYS